VRLGAPSVFRTQLHLLASKLAAEPDRYPEPRYMATARALIHCAEMDGQSRVKMIRQLERQLAAQLFKAMPVNDPLQILGGKA